MSREIGGFPKLNVVRKTGDETFQGYGAKSEMNLRSFWQWAASDLVSNAMRGVLAEYIVASALGIAHGVRAEWDAFDLITNDGIKIEVKSASYIQSWYHKNLSKISFSIKPSFGWDAETNSLATELKRQADIYVFCVLAHQEQETIDPLNLDQWEFYVSSAAVLNQKYPTQKSIGLSSLLKLNPIKARYENLAECVSGALEVA